jgi:hypothetical protein
MSSLERRQMELQARLDAIAAEIQATNAAFTALAREFSGVNGQHSLREASKLELALSALKREQTLTLAAVAHCTAERLREKEAQAEAERRALQAERQQHVDALAALSAECDEFLGRLRGLLERRASHLHSLGSLGANPAILAKLGKPALTRTACYHGLAKFFALERVAPTSLLPLSSTQTLVAGLGKEATAAPLASSLSSSAVETVESPGDLSTPTTNGGQGVLSDDKTPSPTNGSGNGEPARRRRIFGGGPGEV